VRTVGEITSEKLDELKKATRIVEEGFKPHNPDQYFAAIFSGETLEAPEKLTKDIAEAQNLDASHLVVEFLKEKGTGIVNGKRAYGAIAVLQVSDQSGKTMQLGYKKIEEIRRLIQDRYPEITRVLYFIEGKEEEGYAISLRAIKTKDFITASLAEIPWLTLKEVSGKILNTCTKVSRVYFDVTPKPPATIEFE